MCTTARAISSSVSDASPPFGGMAPLPLITVATIPLRPSLMCGAQALASPIRGAFATPVWWQVAQVAFTMASPVRAPGAAAGAPNSTRPTGWMRAVTDSGGRAVHDELYQHDDRRDGNQERQQDDDDQLLRRLDERRVRVVLGHEG